MNEWVLCIAGIAVISVLCDVILPEGSTAKYVKTVIGFLITVTMLVPIAQVFDQMENGFDVSDGYLQSAYVEQTENARFDSQCKQFKSILSYSYGITDVSVELDGENVVVSFSSTDEVDLNKVQKVAETVFDRQILIVRNKK